MKGQDYISYITLTALIVLLPFLSVFYEMVGSGSYGVLAIISLVALFLCITTPLLQWRIRRMDILITFVYSWILVTSLFLNNRTVSDEKLILLTSAFITYFCARLSSSWTSYRLAVIMIIGGIIQSLMACGQYLEIIESNHLSFPITGSFHNPAHLGAYLGLSLICGIYLLQSKINQKDRYYNILLSLLTIFIGVAFIASFSRASWVAFFIVGILFIIKSIKRKYYFTLGIAILCSILLFPLLYYLKQDSANGRLFIWKVSQSLVSSAPLQGHGAEGFAATYMLAQADYFEQNPRSDYKMKATDNVHAFNEFLRITCEYGLVGLLLSILLLCNALNSKGEWIYKFLLIYLCVFSFFSYIAEIPVLLLLCSLFIGRLPDKIVTQVFSRRVFSWGCSLALLSLLLFTVTRDYRERRLTQLLQLHVETEDASLKQQLKKLYPSLPYNRMYVLSCAHQFYNQKFYADALPYLQKAYLYNPVSDVSMDLGNCHFYLGNYEEAEYYLMKARYMVPSHILPRYYLFRLYAEMGGQEKAIEEGREILMGKFKKEGSVAMEVKHYIKEYLEEHSGSSSK